MDDLIKSMSDKITSYNLFNNLFPGAVFCALLNEYTRLNIASSNIVEQLFVWYFVGMIISRIGSIIVENLLKAIKIGNKEFISFADYDKYTLAAEKKPHLKTMSEINNTYRTVISLLCCFGVVYFFDILFFDWVKLKLANAEYWIMGTGIIFLIALFVFSYRKQTTYIKKQVENTK